MWGNACRKGFYGELHRADENSVHFHPPGNVQGALATLVWTSGFCHFWFLLLVSFAISGFRQFSIVGNQKCLLHVNNFSSACDKLFSKLVASATKECVTTQHEVEISGFRKFSIIYLNQNIKTEIVIIQ